METGFTIRDSVSFESPFCPLSLITRFWGGTSGLLTTAAGDGTADNTVVVVVVEGLGPGRVALLVVQVAGSFVVVVFNCMVPIDTEGEVMVPIMVLDDLAAALNCSINAWKSTSG